MIQAYMAAISTRLSLLHSMLMAASCLTICENACMSKVATELHSCALCLYVSNQATHIQSWYGPTSTLNGKMNCTPTCDEALMVKGGDAT